MQIVQTGGRRWPLLPLLIIAGILSHGALAQSLYRQDSQFRAPSQRFNFQEVSWLGTDFGSHVYLLQRGCLDLTIWTSAGAEVSGFFPNQLSYPHSVHREK